MKAAMSLGSCTLSVVACFLLVSLVNSSPSRQLHNRYRREAEAAPEPEPDSIVTSSSSSPMSSSMSPASSTPSSSSVMMSHEGHNVTCDEKDTASLKTACPGNGTCSTDNETLEKCCHCISTCCDAISGNGTNGKDMGTKVKDAISSAEGWLKNQGQNIKNSWDKAKEGIKQTANDVKDKVKKGMDTVANKFRNATGGSSENSTESMENSSESNTPMPMTPTPGQKTKRDLYGLASPSKVETYYSGSKKDSSSDESDSAEYSWSRRTTSMNGNSDMNTRRYKREMSSNPNAMSSNNSTTGASNSTSATDKTARTKRGADKTPSPGTSSSNSSTTETSTNNTRSKRDNHHNESNSDPLPAVKTSRATTVIEGTVNESGKTLSSSNSKNRYRRAGKDNKDGTTPSPPEATTGTNGTESEETEEDKDSPQANNSDSSGKNEGKNNSRRRDSNVSISVHVLGPPKSPRSNRNSKGNKGTSGGEGSHHRSDPTRYPILFPGEGDDHSSTMESSEDAEGMDVVVEHPPVVYPDGYRGGVISSSGYSSSGGFGSGSGKSPYPESPKMGPLKSSSADADLVPFTMRIENTEDSMLSSSSGMWRHESDDVMSSNPSVVTDGETSRTNGTFAGIHMDTNSTSNSNIGTGSPVIFGVQDKCRSLTAGVNCVAFQPYASQCSYDNDCTGSMKCCFNTCEPYKHIGICDESISS